MRSLIRRCLNQKKYIVISMTIFFVMGLIFSFFQYDTFSENLLPYFNNLFYFKSTENLSMYQLYVVESIVVIVICTYLSTSYLGFVGLGSVLFLKGIQLGISIQYIFLTESFGFVMFLIMLAEIIIECLYFVPIYMNIHLSLYVMYTTFCIEQTISGKNLFNYLLNILIASLVVFMLTLAFRIYVIPLI